MDKIFSTRSKCIFCNSDNLYNLLEKDYKCSVSLTMMKNEEENCYFMPYSILVCKNCNTLQNKYVANIELVYEKNHIDDYGIIKSNKHSMFCDFILKNEDINGIIEIGACNLVLSNHILDKKNVDYTIIEPSVRRNSSKLKVIPKYFEDVDLEAINGNTLVLSDVFEHFYKPVEFLEKVKNSKKIKYIYLHHPDFDSSLKNNFYINLNCEHTFLIEHQFLFDLFENFHFKLKRRYDITSFSLHLEFERVESTTLKVLNNVNLLKNSHDYYNSIINKVDKMNKIMNDLKNKKFYVWPTSMHISPLFTLGLNVEKITGVLDNSPNKLNKFLYGYKLKCYSFNDLLEFGDENNIIFIGGAGNYINEIKYKKTNVKLIFLNEL